jgi:hypothetical protein
MREAFKVMPLRCDHCGRALPVMGQYVTFQCRTCFRYWVLTPDGLRPITVYRAETPPEIEIEPILLPFWVVGIDRADFRAQVDLKLGELRESTRVIATAEFEMEKPAFEHFVMAEQENTVEMKRARFLSEASRTQHAPSAAEVEYLLRRIEGADDYLIYIPAFLSMNTHAYLKIGRLFTKRQPGYRAEKSSGLGRPVMCALQPAEAVSFIDFIFFATLPETIQMNGDFLKAIRLKPAWSPRLIEFPFERRGSSLVSCIGGFQISGRYVDGLCAPAEAPAEAPAG